jgi:hypothetical protein
LVCSRRISAMSADRWVLSRCSTKSQIQTRWQAGDSAR